MYLQPDDVKLISEIMSEFPNAGSFQLTSNNDSGIGNILILKVATMINNRPAEVTFEISGVDKW